MMIGYGILLNSCWCNEIHKHQTILNQKTSSQQNHGKDKQKQRLIIISKIQRSKKIHCINRNIVIILMNLNLTMSHVHLFKTKLNCLHLPPSFKFIKRQEWKFNIHMVINDDAQPIEKSKKKFPNSNFRLLVFNFQFKTKVKSLVAFMCILAQYKTISYIYL
jgi:hypothetical protein